MVDNLLSCDRVILEHHVSDSTLECTSRLTTSNEDRTMFNGYVVEPLVLLVEVSIFDNCMYTEDLLVPVFNQQFGCNIFRLDYQSLFQECTHLTF